ncbi:MAG: sigma-70 family RNA polymerase sigma factor [Planctomycetes bacterium]|nr:sigma-70 family RNA polymerase sigma factor [Planctomycetota bacterium]
MRITAEEVTRHPFTLKVVRKYARRLIQRGCFSEDERGAVEQELMSKVLENWPKFDESVGHHKSFVCTIVSNSSLNLSRRIDAKCRGSRPVSLSSIIHDPFDGATELAQTIGESELDRRLERKPRLSPTDRVALLHDLQQVMASLTPKQADLIERLKTQSLATIAHELGIPRSTLGSRLAVIREKFREAGLQEYLQS